MLRRLAQYLAEQQNGQMVEVLTAFFTIDLTEKIIYLAKDKYHS